MSELKSKAKRLALSLSLSLSLSLALPLSPPPFLPHFSRNTKSICKTDLFKRHFERRRRNARESLELLRRKRLASFVGRRILARVAAGFEGF